MADQQRHKSAADREMMTLERESISYYSAGHGAITQPTLLPGFYYESYKT